MEEEKKNNKGLYVIIAVLCLLVLGLGGYIIYDKSLSNIQKDTNTNNKNHNVYKEKKESKEDDSKKNDSEEKENQKREYTPYEIGDKVTVELNDSNKSTFYVLKQSSKNEEYVTLFAEKEIGTSAFQEDYTDENEFEGSLIQSKLNELTANWTNVKEKRLITAEEIIATGLTSKKQCGPSESNVCDAIEEDSWLLEKNGNTNNQYWTMSKAVEDAAGSYPNNRYVYIVTLDGYITGYIVGYKPGSEWNKKGNFGDNMGIRPVIVIAKEYVK